VGRAQFEPARRRALSCSSRTSIQIGDDGILAKRLSVAATRAAMTRLGEWTNVQRRRKLSEEKIAS
jgi:hypothetical protein